MFDKECSANETGLNRGEGRSEPIGDRLEDRLVKLRLLVSGFGVNLLNDCLAVDDRLLFSRLVRR